MIRAVMLMLALAAPATAEQVVGALSQDRVSITANFDGSEISIYGAVKREAPVPQDAPPLNVLITIEGPSEPVTVRRKERRLGIWVNTDAVVVDRAPSFYSISTTAPLDDVISETERLRHNIGFDKVVRLVGAPDSVSNAETFPEAVVRIRQNNGLYTQLDSSIDLREETLFITAVALPANLVEGAYRARMFLTRDREVVSTHETEILVAKAGMEKWIYDLAHNQPLLYGILSIAVALFAGWAASEAFRLLRR